MDSNHELMQSGYRRILVTCGHLVLMDENRPLEKGETASSSPIRIDLLQKLQKGWLSQPEEFSYEITELVGRVPRDLKGTFYRNGPGLLNVYGTKLVHPIDGDGMVLALTFKDGRVFFRSSYVKTSGYLKEKEAKKVLLRGMMGTNPEDPEAATSMRFKNPSNTNVFHWGDKLLACWEAGLPYCLDPVTLETIGKDTLNGALDESSCLGAHFRYDPVNDTLVVFSLRVIPEEGGEIYFHEFDRKWNLLHQQVHRLPNYYYCHDFLLLDDFYLIHHSPFYNLDKAYVDAVISGQKAPGQLVQYYPQVPSQFILIPRRSSEPPICFPTEPVHIYHHLNSFKDGKRIFFSSVGLGVGFTMEFENQVSLSNTTVSPGRLYDYVIDLEKKTLTRIKADSCACEFPTVHPLLSGMRWRYGYLMASEGNQNPVPFQDVIKYDRLKQSRKVWSVRNRAGVIGEPVFIPRPKVFDRKNWREEDEDDGWVVVQEYKAMQHKTQFVILNAKNMKPVLEIPLKHHTPYGFHGTWDFTDIQIKN